MAIKPNYEGYTFMTPDEVDAIIKNKLSFMPRRIKGAPKSKLNGCAQKGKVVWTEAELCLRRQVVTDLLCQGLSSTRVKQELMSRWNVSEESAYNYLRDAINSMASDNEVFMEKARDIMIHKLEGVAENALEHNDRKSALAAYEQLNKISGLYKDKIEADVKTEIKFDFS